MLESINLYLKCIIVRERFSKIINNRLKLKDKVNQ